MKPAPPQTVTLAQWLAVLAVWGLAGYGLLAAPKAAAEQEQVKLVACR